MTIEKEKVPIFGDLPQALVNELVEQSTFLSNGILESIEILYKKQRQIQESLRQQNLLKRVEALPRAMIPTTCGADGAYVIERLIGYDFVAVAALALEGLTPPSEKRYWPEPHYRSFLNNEPHREENNLLARALMVSFELQLASQAPHDVVFLDGSFITPITAFHQALSRLKDISSSNLVETLKEEVSSGVLAYRDVLRATRSDKAWVGIPKYTTRKEVANLLGVREDIDDRALLTLLLEPGEFIGPTSLEKPQEWKGFYLHRAYLTEEANRAANELIQRLEHVQVIYYRADNSKPAIRVELPSPIASNPQRLALVIEALRYQCSIPGVMEPFPIYYTDRMSKSVSPAMPALRQTVIHHAVENHMGDPDEIFFLLHSYRTEGG